MKSVGHALVGAVLFGPVGVVASVLPDTPMVLVWFLSDRNRLRLPRNHFAMRLQKWFHSLFILLPLGAICVLLHLGVLTSVYILLSWLVHILIDYPTHKPEERWPLFM